MPVFLSDKETLYVKGMTESISETYQMKLSQNIKKKLRILKLELMDLHANEEFSPMVKEILAAASQPKEPEPELVTDLD